MASNSIFNDPPEDFLKLLVYDEEDSGSELDSLEDEDDEEVQGEPEEMVLYEDIQNMPILSMDDDGNVYPLVESQDDAADDADAEQADSDLRDRSPLALRSPTPPPYSPLSSPERVFVDFYQNEEVVVADDRPDQQSPRRSRGRSRGQPRTRGTRLRGGVRGRRRRTATSAVSGESEWRPGDRIIEICLNDEDVPPELRDMVHDLETARNARYAQQAKRRNVRMNEADDSDDEYYDAQSFITQELFNGDNGALNFQWAPMSSFKGNREKFVPERTGPTTNSSCAYEAFRKFWDDVIIEHIVTETNRYALELKSSSERFARDWYDTNAHEIMILFSFWMMLSIVRMPSIKTCYSDNVLLKTSIFRTLLTQSRYWVLNRALHFTNNALRKPDSPKLFCLGPVVEHLNRRFKEAYVPDQDISIDESLTLWKGKLSFRQYIKTKAARFGVKSFELCESATGYMWSFFIYTGKDDSGNSSSRLPKSTEAVVKLIGPLLNRGYRLFIDNWFTSPILARFLKRNHTDCVGTLRKNGLKVPAIIKLASVPEGRCLARHSGDVVVMAYHDKKPVYTISTHHGVESVHFDAKPGRASHYKPAVIADYNKNMGGVDKKDQMLEPYLIERKKNRKWYKKIFKRLLNVSIFNSRILVDKSRDDAVKQLAFRLELVKGILQHHLPNVPQPRKRQTGYRSTDLAEQRFSGAHYIVRSMVPDNESRTSRGHNSSKNRRTCVWCSVRENRIRKTVYICENCDIPLCLEQCFKKYHTVR